jgi:23S rRNA pseudouridine1911/1915/1917 synthase
MNQGYTYTEVLSVRVAGQTLLGHLCARYGHSSEREWQARIAAGRVLLDGLPAPAESRLGAGQRLAWVRPPWEEPEAPLAFEVRHEDADLLVVGKPSGLPTLPGAQFLEHTLLHQVRLRFPGASPVHRLGRGTSGLVAFARTPEAMQSLSADLRAHRLTKVYRARVEGLPAQDAFTWETPIGPVPHQTLGTVHAASAAGKPARSFVVVLRREGGASLVEVRIETGRPHQIRIHMAACGHPLVGDPLYLAGGGVREDGAVPGDLGYLLHALRLRLQHPRTREWLDLCCEPPEALR